jgi:hypothetical protein
MQKAAIEYAWSNSSPSDPLLTSNHREQQQEARENPIAAAAAAAAAAGGTAPQNAENLLDFDFDGSAPASSQKPPPPGTSGLEGLAGTPQRVASPAANAPANNMDDLMGLFGDSNPSAPAPMTDDDIMNGFGGLDLGGSSQPPPATQQLNNPAGPKSNQELLDLF